MLQNSIKLCCNSDATIFWKTSQNKIITKSSTFVKLTKPQKNTSCIKFVDLPYFSDCKTFLCFTKDSEFNFDKIKSVFSFDKKQA